jgi:hypothetical protein
VFKTCETDSSAIDWFFDKLFNRNKVSQSDFANLWVSTVRFEKEIVTAVHFDNTSLK